MLGRIVLLFPECFPVLLPSSQGWKLAMTKALTFERTYILVSVLLLRIYTRYGRVPRPIAHHLSSGVCKTQVSKMRDSVGGRGTLCLGAKKSAQTCLYKICKNPSGHWKQIYVSWFSGFWASGTFSLSQRTKSRTTRHSQAKSGTFKQNQALSSIFRHFQVFSGMDFRAQNRGRLPHKGMQLFCLQLEASCLKWSFFTYSWQISDFLLQLEPFLLTILAFLLTIELPCLQWESVSEKYLNGL